MTTPIQTTTKTTAAVPCEDCPPVVSAKSQTKCSGRIENPDGSMTIYDPVYHVDGIDRFVMVGSPDGACALFGYNKAIGEMPKKRSTEDYGVVYGVTLDANGNVAALAEAKKIAMRQQSLSVYVGRYYTYHDTSLSSYGYVTCTDAPTPDVTTTAPAAEITTEPPSAP